MGSFRRRKPDYRLPVREFADIMAQLLFFRLKDEELRKDAESFYVELRDDKDYHLFVTAMFNFYMWLVSHTAARALESEEKWNKCMDRFHWLVYEHYSKMGFITADFQDWYLQTRSACSQFENARNKENQIDKLWEVAKVLSRHLFGNAQRDQVILRAISEKAKRVTFEHKQMIRDFQVV